jgi:hypothetical protein
MTTLATLKSQIADDLARDDLTSQIAAAITQAIDFYKEERLFWMDTRAETFDTVADQSAYDVDDDAAIPLFIKIDAMMLQDSDGTEYGPLDRVDDQAVMEQLLDESASTGRPDAWSYYNDTFYFHPIPDDAYTVRPMGQIEVAAPSTDGEIENRWMTKGYELIRCAAKGYIFLHTVKDPNQALAMEAAAGRELSKLRRDTSKRTATGHIRPTQF